MAPAPAPLLLLVAGLLLAACLPAPALAAGRAPLGQQEEANIMLTLARNAPRKTISGKSIPSSDWCAYTANPPSCDWGSWGGFVAGQAVFGIVLAALFTVLFLVFWIGRYAGVCCDWNGTWGGRNASKGIFCTDEAEFQGYSKLARWVSFAVMTVVCVLSIAFIVLAFIGGGRMVSGMRSASQGAVDGANAARNIALQLQQSISQLVVASGDPNTAQINANIAAAVAQGQQIIDTANSVNSYSQTAAIVYQTIGIIFVAAALGQMVISVILGAITCGQALCMPACCALPIGVLLWLLAGATLAGGVAMADTCISADEFRVQYQAGAGNFSGSMAFVAQCSSSNSAYSNLIASANQAVAYANQRMCGFYTQLRQAGCPCSAACPANRVGILSSTIQANGTVTVQACGSTYNSNLPANQQAPSGLLGCNLNVQVLSYNTLTIINSLNAYDALPINQLGNCGYLNQLLFVGAATYSAVYPNLCQTGLSGSTLAFVGYVGLAGMILFFFITSVLTMKRTTKDNLKDFTGGGNVY